MSKSILVVGAGFSGAVYARILAELGWSITVIDRRSHVAGNAFDEILTDGSRLHRYGPHLFHTNNLKVVNWLKKYGRLIPYEHRVQAYLSNGMYVPLPINRNTISSVFNVQLEGEIETQTFLKNQRKYIDKPANAAQYLDSQIGSMLTDLFFRPYTKKMWGLDLEDLSAAVVKRVQLRFDQEDRYFPNDKFQGLPEAGYTNLISNILDHSSIKIFLNTPFDRSLLHGFNHCFNSMAIDEFFEEEFGPLPYRSIRFHHREVSTEYQRGSAATINFTDQSVYTRETDWSRLPHHAGWNSCRRTITQEEPCSYLENQMERYYPVLTSDDRFQSIYARYKERADKDHKCMTFIGRCGTYRYLDMHQVINQSLTAARAWGTKHM